MRLTEKQVSIIKKTALDMFGQKVQVWLFGSRVDDNKRGGDIDLFVSTQQVQENRVAASARFAARLQIKLGDQKIDVVLVDPKTPAKPIHDIARNTGVLL